MVKTIVKILKKYPDKDNFMYIANTSGKVQFRKTSEKNVVVTTRTSSKESVIMIEFEKDRNVLTEIKATSDSNKVEVLNRYELSTHRSYKSLSGESIRVKSNMFSGICRILKELRPGYFLVEAGGEGVQSKFGVPLGNIVEVVS